MSYAVGFIRGVKIISIRGKINGIKFGAGFLYARRGIDFLQILYQKSSLEFQKLKQLSKML